MGDRVTFCPECDGDVVQSDTRWRPMRTAPHGFMEGVPIELYYWDTNLEEHCQSISTLIERWDLCVPVMWRPAHPEWNEEEG